MVYRSPENYRYSSQDNKTRKAIRRPLLFVPVLVGCLETIFYTGITSIPTGPGVADVGPVINVVGYLVIGRANLVNEVNKAADGRSAVLTELDHVGGRAFLQWCHRGHNGIYQEWVTRRSSSLSVARRLVYWVCRPHVF